MPARRRLALPRNPLSTEEFLSDFRPDGAYLFVGIEAGPDPPLSRTPEAGAMTPSQPDLKALFLGALERPEGPERADLPRWRLPGRGVAPRPGRGAAGGPRPRRRLPRLRRRDHGRGDTNLRR